MSLHSITEHPRFRGAEPLIPRRELERMIGYRRSSIQAFIAAGMPVAEQRKGKNLFRLSQVNEWLATHNSRVAPELSNTSNQGATS